MQYILAPHPALHGEHPQNQQRHRPDPRIVQGLDRKRRNRGIHQKRKCQSFRHNEYWCTGKDSNLRTSLGGTDLQSVGFNHSPTCAKPQTRRPNLPADFYFCATQTSKFQQCVTQKNVWRAVTTQPNWKVLYGSCCWKISMPPPHPRKMSCVPEPILELAIR